MLQLSDKKNRVHLFLRDNISVYGHGLNLNLLQNAEQSFSWRVENLYKNYMILSIEFQSFVFWF